MSKFKSKIGVHVSMAGGMQNAPGRAAEEGCETFQCFTRSPQGGPAPKLTDELVSQFKAEMTKHKLETFYIHSPYYINLASLEPRIRESSIRILREELERGSILGAKYVMTHPGSYKDQTLEEAILKVAEAIDKILDGYKGTTEFLVEISAGSGNVLGDTFEEVGAMIKNAKKLHGFGGVCFDTCHAFASGYDYRTKKGLKDVLDRFDKEIGLEWLKMTHVNDSKMDLGQKRDRHEHIGQGFAGREGIANILTSEPFSKIDWILETEPEGRKEDVTTLKKIRTNG